MAEYLIQDTTAQSIVNKVKIKSGITDEISGSEVENAIESILTPTDGTISTRTSSNLTVSGATVTVPSGYYASNASKSVSTATQATPSISVDENGLITASATQSAGYVSAGTKTKTYQLTKQLGGTATPSTSDKVIVAKGKYTTGDVKVAGDSNLIAENIKSGVSIFGVNGTFNSGAVIATGTQMRYDLYSSFTFSLDKTLNDWTAMIIVGNNDDYQGYNVLCSLSVIRHGDKYAWNCLYWQGSAMSGICSDDYGTNVDSMLRFDGLSSDGKSFTIDSSKILDRSYFRPATTYTIYVIGY